MGRKRRSRIDPIPDEKAEALEKAGLWRRAADRWLIVYDEHASDVEREWISERRNACVRKALRPFVPLESFGDVRRAADAAQKKMGIDKPRGKAFRLCTE